MATLILQPSAASGIDTFISANGPSENYGIRTNFFVANGALSSGSPNYKGLIRFTLPIWPTDLVITSATLTIYCEGEDSDVNINVSAYRSLVDWIEGTENAGSDIGLPGSTWFFRNKLGSVAWNGGSGGGLGSDYDATATGNVVITSPGAAYDIIVTADVITWVSGAGTNRGWWLVRPSESDTPDTRKFFSSSDHATASQRPKLTIVFEGQIALPVGTANGVATVTGTLSASAHMIAISNGTATVTGDLVEQGRIDGMSEGVATVTGTMIGYIPTKTSEFIEELLRLIFNATTIAELAENASVGPLTDLYVSLHTANPDETGDQTSNEVAYTGYARVAVERSTSGWTVLGVTVTNAVDVIFPVAGSGPTNVTHVAIGTDATGVGKVLYYTVMAIPIVVPAAQVPTILAGSIVVGEK